MPRTKANIPENETTAQRFVRLAEPRVANALDSIERIGKLANPSLYEYAQEDVDTIITVLKAMVDKVEAQFKNPTVTRKNVFSLASKVTKK